jgi:antitoxin PrlF
MATTLKVTAKGQVTLRRDLLRHLGVEPGDKIAVDFLPDGRAELRSAKSAGSIQRFIGSLERPGTKALSIEEIREAAAEGWAGRR